MKPIRIDFAPRAFRRSLRQTRPLGWLTGFIGLLLCVGAIPTAIDMMRDSERIEIDRQRIERDQAKPPRPSAESKKPALTEAQAIATNQAIRQLNLPWGGMFEAIEAATPDSIALLSLEPDARKEILKGQAEAKNSDEMIAYIESLKNQGFFNQIVLTRHEINVQDTNRPLRFDFEARWNGKNNRQEENE